MTDQPKPEPRIDEHGVGRCIDSDCPAWSTCDFANWFDTGGTGICEPWARDAAKGHRAMEAMQQKNFIALERLDDDYHCWIGGPICETADNPVDAILKAAEAAEKGGGKSR